jgi:3-phenylpropionate/trans-cinnamate dioxygenase ferredoxin reductase subunit
MDQGKVAAAAIVNQPEKYHAVPWFWTHQFELKLQMAGNNAGFDDHVVRGDREEHKFSVYYYKDDQLIGVDSMNRASDHLSARKLLEAGISPSREQAADPEFNLKDLLKQESSAG